jgi:2C-methyl-D-erythritol 2,4-cyclodiphosphate synthase
MAEMDSALQDALNGLDGLSDFDALQDALYDALSGLNATQ